MQARFPINNATGDVAWAIEKINEYAYRKEFGLSYEEFLNEPLEAFNLNSEIMSIQNKIESAKVKKAQKGR